MRMRIPILSWFSRYRELKKELAELKKAQELILKPAYSTLQPIMGAEAVKYPRYELHLNDLEYLAMHSDTLRTIIQALTREIFRNGIAIKSKFVKKCLDCGAEFDFVVNECEECGSKNLKEASRKQKKFLEEFLKKKINKAGDLFFDLLFKFNIDLEIFDTSFLILLKEYEFENNEIKKAKIKEIFKANPKNVFIIANKAGDLGYDDEGNMIVACPICRNVKYSEKEHKFCPNCSTKLYKAEYVGRLVEGEEFYYIEGEVIKISKYMPSPFYGHSPILSCWQKVVTLMVMDRYMRTYFDKQRSPKGIVFVNTANYQTALKALKQAREIAKKDPHELPFFIVEQQGGKRIAEFLNLQFTLQEMQYIQAREEFRRVIGALYGVEPIFQGDISTSGGLNNEGLQITVTNRAVAYGQRVYNEKLFPALMEQLGITDYKLELNPSEEQDEMAELQRMAQKIRNAQALASLGYDVEWDERRQDFVFEKKKEAQAATIPQNATILQENQRFEGEVRKKDDLEKEISEILSKITRKTSGAKRISQGLVNSVIEEIKEKIKKKFDFLLKKRIEQVYREELKKVENEIKLDIGFGDEDFYVLEALKQNDLLWQAYTNFDKFITRKINQIIEEGIENNLAVKDIVKMLKEQIEATEGRLHRIAATEIAVARAKAREMSYKKVDDGTFRYQVIGPEDFRTCDICKRIRNESKAGLTMEEIKDLFRRYSKSWNSTRPFNAHPFCRCSLVRIK